MHPLYVSDLARFDGQTVTLRGWVTHKRSKGKLVFVVLRDGTGIVQAVAFQPDVPERVFAACEALTLESSVSLTGRVRADPRAPGGFELAVQDVAVAQLTHDYPITPKEHGIDFLLDHRHLWLRSSRQHALLRIRATVIRACQEFLDREGFIRVDAPILTPAACEGTSTLFPTDYFGQTVYLTQSGQLYNEAAAMAFGRVYCLGPTFRAERSKTRRHLMEFWMLEPEMAWCEQDENMRVQERLITYVVETVLRERRPDLERLERDVSTLEAVQPPFPRLTYDEALALLRANDLDLPWGEDFGAPHETLLATRYDRPLFVTHFPVQCKAFYMAPDPVRPEVTLSADLLAPEGYGEIVGGGQRVHDLALLEARIAEHSLPRAAFEWYLDLRRYGSVPHAGFGLGIERTVGWIAGVHHIREAIPFPRTIVRLTP
ncbi:MAG: asparagine--tRNA ligase [Chloroflexi bacterium]|nr:asparagine--tRNA ligase [Chloroflexota bacterium]